MLIMVFLTSVFFLHQSYFPQLFERDPHGRQLLFHAAVPRAPSHLLSAGPNGTLARQTSTAARAIGMLISRAKVACCCLIMVNGLTVAELLCDDLRTQAAESLQPCSLLIMEWMKRFQGDMRRVSPAARACQSKRVCVM